jgi:hypothetical protein
MPAKKKVAAVVTEYRRWSHADVILGKILEGYAHDGKAGPAMELVSLYVDQFPKNDWSRDLAKKHGFTIYDTIEKTLTRGGKSLAVDGVLIIGEHGKYPTNKKGQLLYPRRRFFEEVTKVFAASKKSVPVFSDKHLGPTWDDAKWMYDRSRELHVPFLAGSSLPVTWRRPPLKIPIGSAMTEAVQIGYGPFEAYGFHALEGLQCMVERRKGGETGVKSVTCLRGKEMWKALDEGKWSKSCLEAAMKFVPKPVKGDVRELTSKNDESGVFLVEYRDGFRGAVALLNGWATEFDGGAFTVAVKLAGKAAPVGCQFYLQSIDPFGHFGHLVRAIDSMMQTGHAPYPVERTLLTSGVLDAVMTSKMEKGRTVETPYLAIRYTPTDYGFGTDAVPKEIKR